MQHFAALREGIGTARRALELFQHFDDPVGAATAKVLVPLQWQTSGPSADVIALTAEAEADFAAAGDTWGQAYAAMHAIAVVGYQQGPSPRVEQVGRDALKHFEALDDPWAQAHALGMLAELAKSRGDVAEAVRRYEQVVAAARAEGPQWMLVAALVDLGGLVAVQGDEERAVALLAEAAAISRRAGWRRGIAYAWNALGAIARARGDLERARELHREALGIVRELVGWSVPHTLAQLGCAEARLGELDQADGHLREAADLVLNAFEPATAALVLGGQALVALGRDRPKRSTLLLGAADAIREQAGVAAVGGEAREAEPGRRGRPGRARPGRPGRGPGPAGAPWPATRPCGNWLPAPEPGQTIGTMARTKPNRPARRARRPTDEGPTWPSGGRRRSSPTHARRGEPVRTDRGLRIPVRLRDHGLDRAVRERRVALRATHRLSQRVRLDPGP